LSDEFVHAVAFHQVADPVHTDVVEPVQNTQVQLCTSHGSPSHCSLDLPEQHLVC